MQLIACQSCHAQYDITGVGTEQIDCRCGAKVEVVALESRDLVVHRCSSCGAHVAIGDGECDYCSSPIVTDPRLLSLICPECCARNADDARFCGACGVVFDPQPAEVAKQEELPCAMCSGLMSPRTVGGFSINECPTCNGIWCPAQSFDALVKAALDSKKSDLTGEIEFAPRVRGADPSQQNVAYRKCPECDAFMQRRNFKKASGVIIDRCRKHGTWLDADELEQIAGYLLSGGRPDAERFMRETDADAETRYRAARRARIALGSSRSSYTGGSMLGPTDFETRNDKSRLGSTMLGLIETLLN